MGRKKRWGKKYKDTRNWKLYNEQLVQRGEFYIRPRFLSTWNREIEQINAGKEGACYLYPNSMIEFLAILHAKSFDYRACEGIMHALSKQHDHFPIISYSQICRRINQLDIQFDVQDADPVMGVDGSGMKVSNRGEWMRKIWSDQPRKGWIKVVVLGDKKGRIVDVIVGNENLDERTSGRKLVKRNKCKISTLLGDGLHDVKQTFNLCKKLKINPVIKIRENASEKADGSFFRKEKVIEYKKLGYKEWARQNKYGVRWVCTEGIFSAVKRIFGEFVRAVKKVNMHFEAKLKFWAYNQVRDSASS